MHPCPTSQMSLSQMSQVYLELRGISQDVPAKSQLHGLVRYLRCPMCTCTRDYLGHPEMPQLRDSYTAWSHFPDAPCVPGITWDNLECPS